MIKSSKEIEKRIKDFSDEDIWQLYGDIGAELFKRGLIRTRNIVGDRGEYLALRVYNKTLGLPKLQIAPEGTQNVDALSRKGERYSIKTITEPGSTTGVFYGCGNLDDKSVPEIKFEFVIIVEITRDYHPLRIIELNWNQFLKLRRWHSTMRAWNLSLTKKLISEAKIIFQDDAYGESERNGRK